MYNKILRHFTPNLKLIQAMSGRWWLLDSTNTMLADGGEVNSELQPPMCVCNAAP